MTLLTILGTLLLTQGVWSQNWGVNFENQCACKGTTVIIPCTYSYPAGQQVSWTAWSKEEEPNPRLLSKNKRVKQRYSYLGDREGLCTMQIEELQYYDRGEYTFKFETNRDTWTSQKKMSLTVKRTCVTAVVPPAVKEGDMVELICQHQCTMGLLTLWNRDGQAVASPTFPARLEDAGSYQCAVQGLFSKAMALDVQYLPRNTTVWVDPPGVLSPGSSVNLTCSSVANPPILSYTWWRYSGTVPPPPPSPPAATGSTPTAVSVGTGRVLRLPSLEASQAGSYLCKATSNLGEDSSSALLQMAETTLSSLFLLPPAPSLSILFLRSSVS